MSNIRIFDEGNMHICFIFITCEKYITCLSTDSEDEENVLINMMPLPEIANSAPKCHVFINLQNVLDILLSIWCWK